MSLRFENPVSYEAFILQVTVFFTKSTKTKKVSMEYIVKKCVLFELYTLHTA